MKNIINLTTYILLTAFIGGAFASLQAMIYPSSLTIFKPHIFIALNTILFIPAILLSLPYIVLIKKFTKCSVVPSFGLWSATVVGLLLTAIVLVHAMGERTNILNSYVSGEISHEERELAISNLNTFTLNMFYTFLILFSVLTPLLDSFTIKKRREKLSNRQMLKLLSISLIYYTSIFVWRIGLFYAVNIFLFFALWS